MIVAVCAIVLYDILLANIAYISVLWAIKGGKISLKFSIQNKIVAIVYVWSGLEPVLEAAVGLAYELGGGHSGHGFEYSREVCS